MNPARKRTVRLVVALGAAVVLASALIYTSFNASSPALTPSQLLREAQPGRSYQLTGKVLPDSVHHDGRVLNFSVGDPGVNRGLGCLHRRRPRSLPRRARGHRHRGEAGRSVHRRTRLPHHQVPLQVQDRPIL